MSNEQLGLSLMYMGLLHISIGLISSGYLIFQMYKDMPWLFKKYKPEKHRMFNGDEW